MKRMMKLGLDTSSGLGVSLTVLAEVAVVPELSAVPVLSVRQPAKSMQVRMSRMGVFIVINRGRG